MILAGTSVTWWGYCNREAVQRLVHTGRTIQHATRHYASLSYFTRLPEVHFGYFRFCTVFARTPWEPFLCCPKPLLSRRASTVQQTDTALQATKSNDSWQMCVKCGDLITVHPISHCVVHSINLSRHLFHSDHIFLLPSLFYFASYLFFLFILVLVVILPSLCLYLRMTLYLFVSSFPIYLPYISYILCSSLNFIRLSFSFSLSIFSLHSALNIAFFLSLLL
jgi:hypothetical protein